MRLHYRLKDSGDKALAQDNIELILRMLSREIVSDIRSNKRKGRDGYVYIDIIVSSEDKKEEK